jgi:hypothetical protein
MLCPECEKRRIAEGHDTCYPCHIRSVGWSLKGATAGMWNGPTIRERQAEAMTNPNAERV